MKHYAPWVNWVGISKENKEHAYKEPISILDSLKVDKKIPLYNFLGTNLELSNTPYFPHVSFDEFKYIKADVPFHEKWNLNTGILSGDAMLILAYKFFENYQGVMFKSLISLFSKTAIEVCEGQQYDIEFESRTNVAIPEYLKMIEYKTAVLVGASMKMGAIVAKAPIKDQDAIYEFGKYLGIAFQLQDDYLDSFGDSKTFGKQIGGDIVENKKTYLYLKAMELSNNEVKSTLLNLYQEDRIKGDNEVNKVKQIFQETGAALDTKKIIKKYTQKAFHVLNDLNITSEKKTFLRQFGTSLMDREV